MQHARGFTLIEVMIVIVVIAVLAAVGFPSYRDHVAKGQRSQGQQFLSDIAQRQEQFMLDRRQYATTLAALNMTAPAELKYGAPDFTGVNNGATPPVFAICLTPAAGSNLAARNDGQLCINSQGDRWRQPAGNTVFDAGECRWEQTSCRLSGEK